MASFPIHPLIFPESSDLFYLKLRKKLSKQALSSLFQRAPSDEYKPLFRWLYTLSKTDPGGLLDACGQPDALRALLVETTPDLETALPVIVARLSKHRRDLVSEPVELPGVRYWRTDQASVYLGEGGSARVSADRVELHTASHGVLVHFDVDTLRPRSHVSSLLLSDTLAHHSYWRFGLEGVVVSNIDDWHAAPFDSLQCHSQAKLVALQGAVHAIGRCLPDWVRTFGMFTREILYCDADNAGSKTPARACVVADARPLIVAERLLRAQAASVVRTTSLSVPVLQNEISPSAIFGGEAGASALQLVSSLVGEAQVFGFYGKFIESGHPKATNKSFRSKFEKQQERFELSLDQARRRCEPTALGTQLIEASTKLGQWASGCFPCVRRQGRVTRPKRLLLIVEPGLDVAESYLFQQTLGQFATQRRHIVDLIGLDGVQVDTDIFQELGIRALLNSQIVGNTVGCNWSNLDARKSAITKLLRAHHYEAVIGNMSNETLEFLATQTTQELSEKTIVRYCSGLEESSAGISADLVGLKLDLFSITGSDLRSQYSVYERPWPISASFFEGERASLRARHSMPSGERGRLRVFCSDGTESGPPDIVKHLQGLAVDIRVATTTAFEAESASLVALGPLRLHELRREVQYSDIVVIPVLDSTATPQQRAYLRRLIGRAFMCGKPVLAMVPSSFKTLITHEVNGLLSCEHEGLRADVQRCIDEPELLKRMTDKAGVSAYSLESLCDEILQRVDAPAAVAVPMAAVNEEPTLGVLMLHENRKTPWDFHRLKDMQERIQAHHDLPCELMDMSQDLSYQSALKRVQQMKPTVVVADKMPSASGFLQACSTSGLRLPTHLVVTDYHMLGRVDLLQDAYNVPNQRKSLGQWWPSEVLEVVSAYPSYGELYKRAGVPVEATRWLPIPAPERDVLPGPAPSTCRRIIAGGRNLRDLALLERVLPSLPESIRREVHYLGEEPNIDWEGTGITYSKHVNFPEFYQLIQSARFIISPTLEQSSCFGGVSFLDLARTVRKPIITTDLAVIREAIGAHNAILLPVGDDEALFAAIERCATDDSYVDQLAAEFEELSHANRSRWLADYVVQLAKGWR